MFDGFLGTALIRPFLARLHPGVRSSNKHPRNAKRTGVINAMPLRVIAIICVGLAIGAAGAWFMLQTPVQRTTTSGKALIGGPFSLVDASGERVTQDTYKGKKMLVFFGFTSCPDICPGGLQVIASAIEKLGSKADQVVPIFITLDPERDSAEKVGAYTKSFSEKLVGLSGTPEEVAAAAKSYRVYFKKVKGSDPENYNIDHSSIMYLMDEQGQYVTHFPYPITVDELAKDLGKLL